MKRPISRRGVLAAALSLTAGCATGVPAGGGERKGGASPPPEAPSFTVAGVVLDSENIPAGNISAQILAVEKAITHDPLLDADRMEIVASVDTSPDGSYRLEISVGRRKFKYYLSFFEDGRFNNLLYSHSPWVDITQVSSGPAGCSSISTSRSMAVGPCPRDPHKHPPASPKARVIRKYDVAEEITKKYTGHRHLLVLLEGKELLCPGREDVERDDLRASSEIASDGASPPSKSD
jgi:hypothetical protein